MVSGNPDPGGTDEGNGVKQQVNCLDSFVVPISLDLGDNLLDERQLFRRTDAE